MATFTGTNDPDTADAGNGILVGFTGGTVAELQDVVGDAFLGDADNDIVVAGSGSDNIQGGSGADNLDGRDGDDSYGFNNGDVGNGEIISDTGTSGTDTIFLLGNNINFELAAVISGIEALLFIGEQSVLFSASQLPAIFSVTGTIGNFQELTINSASNFSAAAWIFTSWEADDTIAINGTSLGDSITGTSQNDFVDGADGDDVLSGGLGDDEVNGGTTGSDTASYQETSGVTVSLAIGGGQNTGAAGTDTLISIENLIGSALGIDALTGDGIANILSGLGGNDALIGGAGTDTIIGGGGKDTMTGEADADLFDFNLKNESKKGASRDVITDFVRGEDEIDVSGIDAKNGSGNQKFKFIGKNDFHDKAGELHYVKKGGFVFVEGDTNGDGRPDFQIKVDDVAKLTVGDFIL